jgi:enoyl-CoA hydratase
MKYKTIIYEKIDGIAKVTMNRPDVMNAISQDVFKEMIDVLPRAEDDDEVKALVLAGAGDNFCSGHDLGKGTDEPKWPRDPWQMRKTSDKNLWNFTMNLRDFPKPTFAMVQGYCIMGGWKLAMVCDIIIASEDAKFADRAVRWGGTNVQYTNFFFDVGPRRTKEYLWTGDFIDGKEAWRLGMVNRVVPRERLEEETMALAKRITLNSPLALRLSKASINLATDIMGQTSAAKMCYYMDALGNAMTRLSLPEDTEPGKMGIERARERDRRFGDSTK